MSIMLLNEKTVNIFVQQREELLHKIIETLSIDERFIAAWLTGSYARQEQDAFSDIDLTLLVADRRTS